jgi:adenosine deaminase
MFIRHMPKVELHLHLEGTVIPGTLLELAERHGVELPARDIVGVEQLFRYRNFSEFLTVYMALVRAIRSGEDFERLAYEAGTMLARQQVRYAEVMLSPMQHLNRIDLHEAIAGTAAGFQRVERETGVIVRLGLDYGRQYGPELAWEVLEIAQQAIQHGVVAWSIGGNEIGYPPEPFAEVFAAAKAAGLRLMAHAGEVVGPASIWGAVDALQSERLGHGIRSVDDADLVRYLCQRGVVLDICPSSNLWTGATHSWEAHPLRQLYDAGVLVTLNTDDPTFFHTTLIDEYRIAVRQFGFDVDDLCTLVLNGVRASFLPPHEQAPLLRRIEDELIALRQEMGV